MFISFDFLTKGTIIFDTNRKSVGKIYETFGPVCQPFYSIRINLRKLEEFNYKFELATNVFIVQDSTEYTKFIFNVDQLRQIKGICSNIFMVQYRKIG